MPLATRPASTSAADARRSLAITVRTLQFLHALDDRRRAFLADAAAHAVQFAHVQEAVGEDPLGDHADAVGQAQQRHELGLQVGGEAGIGLGGHLDGVQPPRWTTRRSSRSRRSMLHADLLQPVDHRDQVVEVAVLQFQFAVGDGGGDHERAALDAVGDDAVLAARRASRRLRCGPPACRGRVIFAPILLSSSAQSDDFRLAGRAHEDGLALGQRGRAHDVDRAQHGRALRAAEVHPAALEPPAHLADDVAVLGAELRPQLLQPADVQVDRPVADGAAAGDRDDRLPALGQQRPQHADAGPHRLDDVVAGLALLLVDDLDVQRPVERGRHRRRRSRPDSWR